MGKTNNMVRFLEAQNQEYFKASQEIRNGRKISHWMWFIFPQLKDLGRSSTAKFFGIEDLEEASEFLSHPVLGAHLKAVVEAVLAINGKSAHEIFGSPDDVKLRSSMTLFANVNGADGIFEKVIEKYFDGVQDDLTLQLLAKK